MTTACWAALAKVPGNQVFWSGVRSKWDDKEDRPPLAPQTADELIVLMSIAWNGRGFQHAQGQARLRELRAGVGMNRFLESSVVNPPISEWEGILRAVVEALGVLIERSRVQNAVVA